MGSPKNSIDKTDWPYIAKSFGMGLVIAVLLFIGQFAGKADLGGLTELVGAVVPFLVTTVVRYIKDNSDLEPDVEVEIK